VYGVWHGQLLLPSHQKLTKSSASQSARPLASRIRFRRAAAVRQGAALRSRAAEQAAGPPPATAIGGDPKLTGARAAIRCTSRVSAPIQRLVPQLQIQVSRRSQEMYAWRGKRRRPHPTPRNKKSPGRDPAGSVMDRSNHPFVRLHLQRSDRCRRRRGRRRVPRPRSGSWRSPPTQSLSAFRTVRVLIL